MPDINSRGEIIGGRGVCFLTDEIVKSDNRANILVARNGRWFGSAVGSGGGRVFNDHGELHGVTLVGDMNSARGAAGQDGTIGFWIGYPNGGTVQLVAPDSTVVDIPEAWPQGNGTFAILDRRTACWMDGRGRFRAEGMLVPVKMPGDIHNLNLFRWQGKIWLAYHANALERIVVHPEHTLEGYVFPPGFYLCVRETTQGVMLCTAANPLDDPNPPVLLDFNAPRLNLLDLIPKPEEPPPPPPPDEEEPEPDPMEWNTAPEATARKVAELVMQEYPAAWQAAHAHGSHDRTYMDLVAGYLHFGWPKHGIPADPKWGENGKRGTDEKSEDILNYKNPAVPKLGLESYDFFRASMPEAGIVWNNITDPNGAGAKFIVPPKPPDGGVVLPPVDPPATDLQQLIAKVTAMDKRLAELERRPAATDINGKRIALMADNGKYVCADFERGEDGPLVANREGVAGWETFTISEVR